MSNKHVHFNFTASNDSVDKLLSIGDKVCINSSLNNVMFSRAQIIDRIGNQYSVFNLDSGSKELVDSDDIFKLAKEFEKVYIIFRCTYINNISELQSFLNFFSIRF